MSNTIGPNYALYISPSGVVVGWCSEASPEGIVPANVGAEIKTPTGKFYKAFGNGNTGWEREGRQFNITIRGVPILTSGGVVDRLSAPIPPGITHWRPILVTVIVRTASGTLAAGSAGLFTQAGGAGTTIVSPAALTPFTGVNAVRDLNLPVFNTAIVDQNVFARQTVNSGNAGTLDIFIRCQDLS